MKEKKKDICQQLVKMPEQFRELVKLQKCKCWEQKTNCNLIVPCSTSDHTEKVFKYKIWALFKL